MSVEINVREMLEAGVHFGHKKDRWNPKMRPFIFAERNGVHIFDLLKTKESLEKATDFASKVAENDGKILFVGTKNQVKNIVKNLAEKAEMPYLVERWPGGMFTNFQTILTRLKFLKEAEERAASNSGMTKKENLTLKRELDKLKETFEGVKDLRKLPEAIFVVDLVKERIAVKEAKKLGIPVIAIADSNASPDVEYPIPGNDDAVRSVQYITEKIVEAVNKANKQVKEKTSEEPEATSDEMNATEPETDETLEKLEMDAEEKVVVKKSRPHEEVVEEKK